MTATQILEQYEGRNWNDNTKLNLLLAFLDKHPELNDALQAELDEAEATEEHWNAKGEEDEPEELNFGDGSEDLDDEDFDLDEFFDKNQR